MKNLTKILIVSLIFYFNQTIALDKSKNFVEINSGRHTVLFNENNSNDKSEHKSLLNDALINKVTIEKAESSSAVKQLKEYNKSQRIKKVSSLNGLIYDSGWINQGNFQDCSPVTTGTTSAATTQVIPGSSLGVGDETITTTTYTKITFVKDVCQSSNTTIKISKEFPWVEQVLGPINSTASAIPFIAKFNASIKGELSVTSGDECCADCKATPVTYDEYSGSTSLDIDVEFCFPFLKWQIPKTKIQGIYELSAKMVLGPTVSLARSSAIGASGKIYENSLCPACFNIFGGYDLNVHVDFGGTTECVLVVFPGTPYEYSLQPNVQLKVGLTSSVFLKFKYGFGKCPKTGISGEMGWSGFTANGVAKIKLAGFDVKLEKSFPLFPGKVKNF